MASFADLLRAQQPQQESQFDPDLFNELLNRAGISQGQMPEAMARANVQPEQMPPQRESYARYDDGSGWKDAESLPPIGRFSSEKAFGGLDEAMASDRRVNQAVARETLQNKLRAAIANRDIGQLSALMQEAQLNQDSDLKNREIDATMGLGQAKISAAMQQMLAQNMMRQQLEGMKQDRTDAREQFKGNIRLQGIDRQGELANQRAAQVADSNIASGALFDLPPEIREAVLVETLRRQGFPEELLQRRQMKNRPQG